MFDDLLEANQRYQRDFHDPGVTGYAAKGLAVLTCIDTRIDPLAVLGLRPGDAKILRNAGARVTDDALRSLMLATNLLGVTRIAVVQHTDCAVIGSSDDDLRARIRHEHGIDATDVELLASTEPSATLAADVECIRRSPLLPAGVEVAGFVFDVRTGALRPG